MSKWFPVDPKWILPPTCIRCGEVLEGDEPENYCWGCEHDYVVRIWWGNDKTIKEKYMLNIKWTKNDSGPPECYTDCALRAALGKDGHHERK